ncbi:MAG: tyrosine-type recombinase/integrase, partial [Pirellulaceae bacterium]
MIDYECVTVLVPKSQSHLVPQNLDGRQTRHVPALITAGSDAARFAWDEFIYGKLRNSYTRRNYQHAIARFLGWCGERGLELERIAPRDVGQYFDGLDRAPATKKIHLSAIRHFFDQLVLRHVVVLNPASSVRGERLQVIEGKTPDISIDQARRLLSSIDDLRLVGMRDRAIIATLIYTAARVGAVARLRRGDFYDLGDQHYLRLTEKGTKSREIPV